MLRVGVTGGIGSGKTTVCKVFESLGVPVYYADAEAKKLYAENTQLQRDLVTAFGDTIIQNGEVHKPTLLKLAFGSKETSATLNAIVHPFVFAHYEQWCVEHSSFAYTVKEAAILFESGSYRHLHAVVGVLAPEALRIARSVVRDNSTEAEVRARMEKQMSQEELARRCGYLINNDGQQSLLKQVLAIHEQLLLLAQQPSNFLS